MARIRLGLKRILWCAAGAFWLLSPLLVHAQAIRFQPQGAGAAGQGNAFAAQADDASAIHFNPAGLSQLNGVHLLFGTNLLGGSIKYKSPAGFDARGDLGGSIAYPMPSHTYLAANLEALGWKGLSDVTVGLGLTSPFGLNTRYPVDGPFNTASVSSTLPLFDIKPTVSYRVNNHLSIGLGADVYTFASFLGEGHAEQRLVSSGGFGIPAGASVEFSGKGTGAGFNVSLLYVPLRNADDKPLASVGLVYRSQVVLPLRGSLFADGIKVVDASTNLVLPEIYTVAVALWPVRTTEREWKLELDVDYVGWKSVRNLDLNLASGGMVPQPQQWRTVPVISIGTEYKWLDPGWLPHWDVAFRSGYTRTENPIPDTTFNPGIISLSAHTLSIGTGWLCRTGGRFLGVLPCGADRSGIWPKALGLDIAFQEWFYEPRTVAGNLNPAVDGTYHTFVHLGTVSLQMRF